MIWMASREATLTKLSRQAAMAKAKGDLAEAERLYREVVELTETTFGKFDEDYARALMDLSDVLECEQKYSEALTLRSRITNFMPSKQKQPTVP